MKPQRGSLNQVTLAALAAFLCAFIDSDQAFAQTGTLALEPPQLVIGESEAAEIQIILDVSIGVTTVFQEITFDPDIVEVSSITSSMNFPLVFRNVIDNINGFIEYSVSNSSAQSGASLLVGTITLVGKTSGHSGIDFDPFNVLVLLPNNDSVALTLVNSSIWVSDPLLFADNFESGDLNGWSHVVSNDVDSDGDRLLDIFETNTGIFVSPTDTGTSPLTSDTDGDGIHDGDEVLGTLGGLDLPGMGLSPLKKEILMEYDWFDDNIDCSSHSHRPAQTSVNLLAAAFENSPVSNPDGTTGIRLIQDYGQGGLFTGGNLIPDDDGVIVGSTGGTEFQSHKAANFDPTRSGYFHYGIFPHRTTLPGSGYAEFSGDDFVVSLSCGGWTTSNVASTIMHELGHNLGLGHGGLNTCNYKPNYNSVMNYRYQFAGIDTNCTPPGDGVLNYSRGERTSLIEDALDEGFGICGSPAWDWNGNGVIEASVVFDVNYSPTQSQVGCGGTITVLLDHNDWGNLDFLGIEDSDFTGRSAKDVINCRNMPTE